MIMTFGFKFVTLIDLNVLLFFMQKPLTAETVI